MGTKRRHTFGSWTDAEIAYQAVNKSQGVLSMALNDILHERVEWFKKGQKKIGVARLEAPHGGIVILSEKGMTGAYYLEDWAGQMLRLPAPSLGDEQGYHDWLDSQEMARWAKRRQNEVSENLKAAQL